MKPAPWELDILYVSVDPAQRTSAFAYQGYDEEGRRHRGAFHISDIRFAAIAQDHLEALPTFLKFKQIVVAVEYPTWNAGASQVVRGAANTFIRLIKDIYAGRKVVVKKVDPNEWQRTFCYKDRSKKQTTKEYSLFLALKIYDWKVTTHDEADAAMILEHIRYIPPELLTIPKRPKQTKKKPNRNR